MRFLLFVLSVLPILAQDGGQLYNQYCSACHGIDGKGATGGQFPPLAGSEWPLGNSDRSIKIVLMGFNGPVEVNGKTYNLEMPPQGAALRDEQISAILTHLRSSWGNKASAVSADQVKKVRAELGNRNQPWTAEELLKLHPLENVKVPIEKLISHFYKANFSTLPDFSQLKPNAVEEEPSGLIDYSAHANTDGFAMMWEGEITTSEGNHEFSIDSDDCSRLIIDGKTLCEINSTGPAGRTVKKSATLSAGVHKIRVEYVENVGQEALKVGIKSKGDKKIRWLSKETGGGRGKPWPEIMLTPTADRTVIYRNFIEGTTPRGIGFGFPAGVNIAYSGDNLTAELLWTGEFIDAGHHWTDRGTGNEPPAGDGVVRLSKQMAYALTADCASAWSVSKDTSPRFRGYQLDPKGNPTFVVEISGGKVLDNYTAATSPALSLIRKIKTAGKLTRPVSLLIQADAEVKQSTPASFESGPLKVAVEGATFRYAGNTVILDLKDKEVLIRYTWN